MDKMKMESPDMTAQNIDRIAALFPNCITETVDENGKLKRAINFELLKQVLSPDVVDGDERYEFTWVGKKAAIVEANKPIRKTLRPCKEESKNWDTTENLYIEGDNLEVLKLLQESYLGKVKMIYIDPPYNTGNDFIYADDFKRSQEEENEQMGMFDEDGDRLFKNTDTNGRFHSDWCSMIYSMTLSATPIPRTLNMAMSGIRDLSTIEQPPIERQPVETFVLEYNDVILAEAMKKELARGGQVYYLHNRVDNIESTAAHVSQLVPGARVGIAHGKMTEEELNPVWQHLLNDEIDILVCTTLIETGIDVRNCNTLIIEDADRMGLAQLYQIRGRVGRSGRKAYAYFTFRRDKTLTDIAQKRLSAIREFTAFGSGFRIAMRDLQIRGAGSLLGHSQHGHMEAVGYDLYVKMLGQAIARAKGEPVRRDKSECLVDLRVDAFIPEKYIADGPGRIEAYKRIAAIQTAEDAADVLDELIDRYGDPPPSVSDLVNVSLVRVQASTVGVTEVTQKKDTLTLQLESLELPMIRGLLVAFNGRVTAGAGNRPYLSVTLQPDEKPLELLQSILKAMAEILASAEQK